MNLKFNNIVVNLQFAPPLCKMKIDIYKFNQNFNLYYFQRNLIEKIKTAKTGKE